VTTTGSTLIAGAHALKQHGASDVWIFVTHASLNADGLERLANADNLAGIVVTDTVPIDPLRRPKNMTVLPIAGLLAETIMNVFSDDSVSAIFGDDTQLF
jgi:ribose-phosphate pyrophosphokinase